MAEANGLVNGKANGQTLTRKRHHKPQRSILGWSFGVAARLLTWAAILTVLFRCPPSLEACDETSPFICKHYFQAKNAVAPHVQPYYDHYAAPYVEVARPYYKTVDAKVLKPTRAYAVRYGAPWVEKGRHQALAHWQKNGQPQLAKVQELVKAQYDQTVAPHVSRASDAFGPYYEIARINALQVFYEFLVPSYEFVQPYAAQGYDAASDFTTTKALPSAYWAWNKTYAFLNTQIWPHLRVVYVANVEPQLLRIGERLGRYNVREKIEKVIPAHDKDSTRTVIETPSSFVKPAPQSLSHSATVVKEPVATIKPTKKVTENEPAQDAQDSTPQRDTDVRKSVEEMVARDLEQWQTKFAAQADSGAADMEERVGELAKNMIEENAQTTGKDLVDQLKSTIDLQMQELRAKIVSLVESAEGHPANAETQVITAIRSSGMAIKKAAQVIRDWREQYDKELHNTVIAIADVHFQILEETRNLALQQIGMRWAWTDGITYKDWAKYHELKSTLSDWTEQLKNLVVTHPALLEAQDASAHVEEEGMEAASTAAKELASLKEVAHWKILAKDTTDNFDIESLKEAVNAVNDKEQAIHEEIIPEELQYDTTPAIEADEQSLSADSAEKSTVLDEEAATEHIEIPADAQPSALNENDKAIQEDETSSVAQEVPEELLSEESSPALEGEAIPQSVLDDVVDTSEAPSATAESKLNGEDAATETSEPGEEILDEGSLESDSADYLVSEASAVLMGEPQTVVSNDSEDSTPNDTPESVVIEGEAYSKRGGAPISEEEPVRPALFGAMAQKVPERKPILEDYVDSDEDSGAVDAAKEVYSTAVSQAYEQYTSAVSVISAQIYGTPKPVHGQLFASVSAAYDDAIAAASSKWSGATKAAESAVKGTPTTTAAPNLGDWSHVESIAAEKLKEGRLWAEIQYQSALLAMGLATPTPSSPMEKYYEQAKFNYFAGLGVAHDRYASFVASASAALAGLTATATPTNFAESASSVASVARESAASAAQAAGDNIASAVNAVDESISSVVDAANEQISSAGEALADSWSNVVAEISGRIYGEEPSQIGWYEHLLRDASSVTDQAGSSAATASAEASKQYDAVSELVSELISGKEPNFTESVMSRLQAAYATAAASAESLASEASEAAASVGDKVSSAASQATEAVKEKIQHGKDEL